MTVLTGNIEKLLQEGIQTTVRAITSTFGYDQVTINDLAMLDEPILNAPYFIILNGDDFLGLQDTITVNGTLNIPAMIVVAFDDWETSLNAFRDARQAVINKFNEVGTARSAGGYEGVDIRRIRPGGPVDYITAEQDNPQALPVFITQQLIFEVELF